MRFSLLAAASTVALACQPALAAAPVPPAPPAPAPAAAINPYGRDIDLTAPVDFRHESLGEVALTLTRDSRVLVASADLAQALAKVLSDAGKARLGSRLGTAGRVELSSLAGSGIELAYDPQGLSLEVVRIDPNLQSLQSLFKRPHDDDEKPDVQPAGFSAFANLSAVDSRLWRGPFKGTRKPDFYFDGALRLGQFVLEGDGQLAAASLFTANSPYRLDRHFVRLVYDQPDDFRRWSAGDLTPEIRGLQGYVALGGVGVSRERLRFDQFQPAVLQGNRQLVLDRSSTIDVYRNGALYQQFRLEPGSYDLSSLPLVTGSNDIRVDIRDDSGRVQSLAYQSYLDPIDLAPGDFEYSAYIGRTANRIGLSPSYGGPLAFTGFYRKAFVDHPAVGIGVQASSAIQQLTGQTQFVILGGTRLLLQAGVSHAIVGMGYGATVALDKVLRRGELTDALSFQVSYTSRRFGGLGYDRPDNGSALAASALYSRGITPNLTLLAGGNYLLSRGTSGDSYRIFADGIVRLSRKWRFQGGIDYTKYASSFLHRGGLGFSASLVFQPNYRDRVEVQHDSALSSSSASYLHSSSNTLGSVGFGAIVDKEQGAINAQGFANYVGNRFDASLSQSTFGSDFQHITEQQITTARVTTSFAFADGAFGIGRRINDSFAVLIPHPTLRGHDVVAGQSLSDNQYMSRSGALGGAINGYLASYITQTIQYDVANPPPGYDTGSGSIRVRPPYHSGYKIRIGTDAFVSAIGTLQLVGGKPVPLEPGRIESLDEPGRPSMTFFTNSAGRFAIQNLKPGGHYRVVLGDGAGSFDVAIPRDSKGLADLHVITVAPQKE